MDWPTLPGFDYTHGFPLDPAAAALMDCLPLTDNERQELLQALEQAAFAAVRVDIQRLPTTPTGGASPRAQKFHA